MIFKPVFKFIATPIDGQKIKYHFTATNDNENCQGFDEVSFYRFIEHLGNKNIDFVKVFIEALKDANSKFPAYFWECPPVTEEVGPRDPNQKFEFVVTKSDSLASMKQDFSRFDNQFGKFNISSDAPQVVSFDSPNKDGILVCPSPYENQCTVKDHNKNISEFTKHAPLDKQLELWKEVATQLFQQLAKNDGSQWLSTSGTGVPYLHVRIYNNPKYYSHTEYKNAPQQPQTPGPTSPIPGPTGPNQTPTTPNSNPSIEKIIRNIEKVAIDPANYLANAELLKNQQSSKGYLGLSDKKFYRIEIEGEEIDLRKVLEGEPDHSKFEAITQAIINHIKKNPTDWEVIPDEASALKICRNQKTGYKCWQPDYGWLQLAEGGKDFWKEVETIIKNPSIPSPGSQSSRNLSTESKWYKPTDYPGAWMAAVSLFLFLIIVSVLIRNSKKKKKKKQEVNTVTWKLTKQYFCQKTILG